MKGKRVDRYEDIEKSGSEIGLWLQLLKQIRKHIATSSIEPQSRDPVQAMHLDGFLRNFRGQLNRLGENSIESRNPLNLEVVRRLTEEYQKSGHAAGAKTLVCAVASIRVLMLYPCGIILGCSFFLLCRP